jgi:hypothetical protein
MEILLGPILMSVVALILACINSAYRNGVTDGFGYAREPWNPGYRQAGDYLKNNLAHRWPDLDQSKDTSFTEDEYTKGAHK